ncbi:MAG: PLP-dependent aminotransferase family protein [Streptococcus sp.]|nr:PLP-dependent aminotransferase family protein [Streptococcus sp.]
MINLTRETGSTPLYEQIYEQLKKDIIEGDLSPNDKMLGTRTLSHMLEVSRNTVDRAYMQLSLEGYIESRKNAGFYVLELPKVLKVEEKYDFIPDERQTRKHHSSDTIYDLTNSSHTSNLFPKKVWKKHYLNALSQLDEAEEFSNFQEFQGDLKLRNEICRYLKRIRGVECSPEQVVITSGLQQSLDYLCHFLGKEKGSVLMEDPSYPKARAIFKKNSYQILQAKVDDKGMVLEKSSLQKNIDLIYTTPSHQFPLGMIMPIKRRQELLSFAELRQSLIIEDDYDSELRYYEKPVPALKSIDYIDRVVYLGTFSKMLSPSFRMSYMVLPKPFTEAFLKTYKDYNSTVNLLNQVTLANILATGDYDRIVRKMNQIFKKRYEAFKRGFENFPLKVNISHNVSGQYLLLTFPEKINQSQLIEKALMYGVKVYDTMQFWQEEADCPQESLFLGFSKIDLVDIPDCIERLKKAWK